VWRRALSVSLLLLVAVAAGGLLARPVVEAWLLDRVEAALGAALVADVRIDGPLEWRLWPAPWLAVSGWTIEADGDALATVEQVVLRFDGAALRRAELVVEYLELRRPLLALGSGYRHWLDPNARTARGATDGGGLAFAVRELAVREGRIEVREEGLSLEVTALDASVVLPADSPRSGRILIEADIGADIDASGDRVSLAGRLQQQGRFVSDDASHRLDDVAVRFEGRGDAFDAAEFDIRIASLVVSPDMYGEGIEIAGRMAAPDRQWRLSSSIAVLRLASDMLTALAWDGEFDVVGVSTQADGKFAIRELVATGADQAWAEFAAEVRVSGAMEGAARFDGRAERSLDDAISDLVNVEGRLEISLPHPVKQGVSLAGALDSRMLWWPARSRAEGVFRGRFDDSQLDGSWALDAANERPLHVEIEIDRLDLDGYFGEPPPDSAPDLAPWRKWPLSARLRLGELRWQGLVTTGTQLLINPD
jgi:hypothetical protein